MMDWIKVRADIFEDATVLKLSDICRTEDAHTVGLLVRFWSWAGRQTAEGEHIEITAARLDKLVGHPGFAAALLSVGWLAGTDGDYSIPDFQRHNGQCAKARALEAEAKRIRRKDKDRPDKMSDKCRTKSGEKVGPEKRREEKMDDLSLSPAGAGAEEVVEEEEEDELPRFPKPPPKYSDPGIRVRHRGDREARELIEVGAEGPRAPRTGFPTRQTVLDYAAAKGWDLKEAAKFWCHADDHRSNGTRGFSPEWAWWSALEKWILNAPSMNRRGGRGAGTVPKQTINDYDKPDQWTQEQMTLGEPTP